MQALRRVSSCLGRINYNTIKNRSLIHHNKLKLFSTDATTANGSSSTTANIEELKKELSNKEIQLKELKDSYLLSLADMENLRNRTKRDVEAAGQFAIQRFCKDIISVIDVLEMALGSVNIKNNNETDCTKEGIKTDGDHLEDSKKQLQDMMKGLSMTLEELHKVFAKHGVIPIDPKQ